MEHYVVVVFFTFLSVSYGQFEVPDALVEVFKPRGLRVSIPDVEGIKLFAFHGKVNEELNGREGGTFSRDIIKAKNGRWTFYDAYAKLNVGDTLYYWTYVDYFDGRNKLGYTNDDQKFTVTELRDKDSPVTPKPVEEVTLSNGCKTSPTSSNGRELCAGQKIFSDDFNNFQSEHWTKERRFAGAPDYEFVTYTDSQDNLQVNQGRLKIKPLPILTEGIVNKKSTVDLGSSCTGVHGTQECVQEPNSFLILPPVTSAQISTKGKFSFKYGKVEIRAKLPRGDWIYPQLFLNPANNEYGSGYSSGQLRIAFLPGNSDSSRVLKGGCILGESLGGRSYAIKSISKNDGSWTDSFHKYTLIWSPDHITVSVDDTVYANIYPPQQGFVSESRNLNLGNVDRWRKGTPLAPFDKEMYLVIGVGVGGHYSFEDRSDGKKPWKNLDGKAQKNFYYALNQWYPTWSNSSLLDVDYVKVWAL